MILFMNYFFLTEQQEATDDIETAEIAEEALEIEAEAVVRRYKRKGLPFGWKRTTNKGLLQNFLENITPLDEDMLKPSNWCYEKFLEVIQAPLFLVLLLTIPMVDYSVTGKKWCKVLNVIHCITFPQLIAFLFQGEFTLVKHISH